MSFWKNWKGVDEEEGVALNSGSFGTSASGADAGTSKD